jgi:hypothetical protein
MEEVLDILNQPADERAPVVALDERPVQLLDAARPGTPMTPGKVARRDYEYVRCGTANVFCVVEPKGIDTFGDRDGRRLWARFTVHYTPKHGSWLNPAELEASLWSRECLGRDRISTFTELDRRTRAWNACANRRRRSIRWRFTTADARRVFAYKQSVTHESKH